MRAFFLSVIAVAGLTGCAINSDRSSVPMAGSYACHLQDEHENSIDPIAHLLTIRLTRQTEAIEAVIDAKPIQILAQRKGDKTTLFASGSFAWRPQANAGTLTDIESIQTFACVRDPSMNGALTSGDTSPALPQSSAPFLRRRSHRG